MFYAILYMFLLWEQQGFPKGIQKHYSKFSVTVQNCVFNSLYPTNEMLGKLERLLKHGPSQTFVS